LTSATLLHQDYIGLFACTAGIGMDKLLREYDAKNDDYGKIMAQALGDRLAEAFAEKLHREVRTTDWGYSPDEEMSPEDMLKVSYQGIRPAPGYPSQPDHTEKATLWELLQATDLASIELTESLAMLPAASVSGMYALPLFFSSSRALSPIHTLSLPHMLPAASVPAMLIG